MSRQGTGTSISVPWEVFDRCRAIGEELALEDPKAMEGRSHLHVPRVSSAVVIALALDALEAIRRAGKTAK